VSWLTTLEGAWHLDGAVSHFNRALDVLERGGHQVDAARSLCEALNGIRAEWSRFAGQEEMSEVETFQAMLAQALYSDAQAELLSSDEVAELLALEPGAVPHGEASRAHVLQRLAELSPISRPNAEAIPLQLLLVNLLLDKPGERLVIYGTLAPGKANHSVIEDLSGQYCDCSVNGRVSEVDGLPYFTWTPSGDSLDAQLFSSKQLPEKWDDLDRFEGAGYKRRLIPATTDGGLSVASIYLSTADD